MRADLPRFSEFLEAGDLVNCHRVPVSQISHFRMRNRLINSLRVEAP